MFKFYWAKIYPLVLSKILLFVMNQFQENYFNFYKIKTH